VQRSIGYNLATRSDALWRLGRYDEAQTLLDQAVTIADSLAASSNDYQWKHNLFLLKWP